MPLFAVLNALCTLSNSLEAAGIEAAQIAKLDGIIDALAAVLIPLMGDNDREDPSLCPTCGAPLCVEVPHETA